MPQSSAPEVSPGTILPSVPPGVSVTTLDNGLVVIVKEDRSAPVVSAQAWCMAGSIHEGKWLGAGLSHVLEHMLFKGTTTRAGSRIDQEVQEAGGYMNAYTSFDRTVYHIDAPSTGATVAIDILTDIMQNATLPAEELEKEMQVILREMDMNVDDPHRRASRRLFETAYTRSPYRLTVIGYPDIFHDLKRGDIYDYYREKYAANNTFYVVVGDVNPEQIVTQIRNAYVGAKARPLPPQVLPEEPRQTAPREIIEEASVELGYFHIAWHTPELRHPEVPLLDILAVLLGNGRSSRLYRQVREAKRLVHSIDAWSYSPGAPGLFGISATVDPENFVAAQEAIHEEIEQLRISLVNPDELQKAVKQFTSATLSTRKTMQGQAQDLGACWLAASDLNFSQRYLEAIRRASPEALQQAAREYLSPENRTLYALLPTGTAPKMSLGLIGRVENPIQKFTLPNGLRLLVKEDHRLPFVEFRAVFKGGLLVESPENCGITQLMGKLLLKGTSSRSADEIAREIESVGGSIDSYGGNNSFGVNAEVMSSDFTVGLSLVTDVLLNPVFSPASLDREREIQLAALLAQKDNMLQTAAKSMRRGLFGDRGYGLDSLGTEESLNRLTPDSLRAFHRIMTAPSNCVVAVYGDVEANAVHASLSGAVSRWSDSGAPLVRNNGITRLEAITRLREKKDKKQAVMMLGFPGTTLDSKDRYALELVQEACSDLGSRLFIRVREKLGLAYFVGAQNFVGLAAGYFAFYVGTEPGKTGLVEQELLAEAETLAHHGLTEEELKRAKAKIIGQKKIARQDLGGLALATALDELYGLGYQHIDAEDSIYEAVTAEEVKDVCGRYLTPDRFVVATVGPE